MNHDLIERYIYAVTRRMPRKQQEDVAQELRGLIDDMLTERCGGVTPGEKDVRVVLTELGSPQELYAKYDSNGEKCLIGQPYYGSYIFVLKIVLACDALGVTVSAGIRQLLEPQIWYGAAALWLAMLWQGLLSAFAVVTILFAVFYRKGVRINEPFNFDDLPPVPKKNQEISVWEPVARIVFCAIFTLVFLLAPEVLGFFCLDSGERIPVFDVDAIRSSWYVIAALAVCGITGEAVKLSERRYDGRVLWTTVVTNLISAALLCWWLWDDSLFLPAFAEKMQTLSVENANFIGTAMGNFHFFLLGIGLIALLIDTVETLIKTLGK